MVRNTAENNSAVANEPARELPIVDQEIYDDFCELMGEKFGAVIQIYQEDTARYLEQMDRAIAQGHLPDMITLAHTIKSSSRQIGFMRMQAIAEIMEHTLREGGSIDSAAMVRDYTEIKSAFADILTFLNNRAA